MRLNPIIKMADELRNFGSTLDLFETALEDFDGAAYGDPLISIADGINVLSTTLSNFNFVDSKIRCYENVNVRTYRTTGTYTMPKRRRN